MRSRNSSWLSPAPTTSPSRSSASHKSSSASVDLRGETAAPTRGRARTPATSSRSLRSRWRRAAASTGRNATGTTARRAPHPGCRFRRRTNRSPGTVDRATDPPNAWARSWPPKHTPSSATPASAASRTSWDLGAHPGAAQGVVVHGPARPERDDHVVAGGVGEGDVAGGVIDAFGGHHLEGVDVEAAFGERLAQQGFCREMLVVDEQNLGRHADIISVEAWVVHLRGRARRRSCGTACRTRSGNCPGHRTPRGRR